MLPTVHRQSKHSGENSSRQSNSFGSSPPRRRGPPLLVQRAGFRNHISTNCDHGPPVSTRRPSRLIPVVLPNRLVPELATMVSTSRTTLLLASNLVSTNLPALMAPLSSA